MKIKSLKGTEAKAEYRGSGRWSIEIPARSMKASAHLQNGSKKGLAFRYQGHEVLFQVSDEAFSALAAEEEKRDREDQEKAYEGLKKELPSLPEGEQTLGKEEIETLKEKIEELRAEMARFTDEEDEGIRLSLTSQVSELQKKLEDGCSHEWEIEFFHGYTQDGRKELRRVATCPKCGARREDVVSEPVAEEAMWR